MRLACFWGRRIYSSEFCVSSVVSKIGDHCSFNRKTRKGGRWRGRGSKGRWGAEAYTRTVPPAGVGRQSGSQMPSRQQRRSAATRGRQCKQSWRLSALAVLLLD